MKKTIALLLSIVMVLSLCACGKNNNFVNDRNEIIGELKDYTNSSIALGNEYFKIAAVTGTADLFPFINKVLNLTDDVNTYLANFVNLAGGAAGNERAKWDGYVDALFGTSLRAAQKQNRAAVDEQMIKAYGYLLEYKETLIKLYADVGEPSETIPNSIKTFKNNYGEKHPVEVEHIVNFYLVASEFADKMLSPKGTLNDISNDITNYTQEINQILKVIELE